jgi:predicted dithiol-disulfide oxidoreductase (DUF899 family)
MARVKAAGCATLAMCPAPSSSTSAAPLTAALISRMHRERCILGADDQQGRPVDAGKARPQVIVGQRRRAARKALKRRREDHAAQLVEHRGLGGDEFRRKPARYRDVGQRRHALLGPQCGALVPLLRRGRRRGGPAGARDDTVEPVGVALRQEQRSYTAHGQADEMRALNRQRVHQRDHIRSQQVEAVFSVSHVGTALPALVVAQHAKRFMMGPGAAHQCVGCSLEVDHLEGLLEHLENYDVIYAVVARAPISEIEAVRQRMGWRFPWVSSFHNDFNYDFNVSFTPKQVASGEALDNYQPVPELSAGLEDLSGDSVFHKHEKGQIFHTYSSYGRGGEQFLGIHGYLDVMPKGRNETGPYYSLTDWARPKNLYGKGGMVEGTGRYHASACACAVHTKSDH